VGIAIGLVFMVIAFVLLRERWVHDRVLWDMEAQFRRIEHPDGTMRISKRSGVGVLWGSSDHCDYFVGQLRRYPREKEDVVKGYRGQGVEIEFIENRTILPTSDGLILPYDFDVLDEWGLGPSEDTTNLYIVYIYHFGDIPGLDFRCM
jgi:hypothetical protein